VSLRIACRLASHCGFGSSDSTSVEHVFASWKTGWRVIVPAAAGQAGGAIAQNRHPG
jgi:hypothetical protein